MNTKYVTKLQRKILARLYTNTLVWQTIIKSATLILSSMNIMITLLVCWSSTCTDENKSKAIDRSKGKAIITKGSEETFKAALASNYTNEEIHMENPPYPLQLDSCMPLTTGKNWSHRLWRVTCCTESSIPQALHKTQERYKNYFASYFILLTIVGLWTSNNSLTYSKKINLQLKFAMSLVKVTGINYNHDTSLKFD